MAISDLSMATQLDPLRTYPCRYRAAILIDDQKEAEAIAELTKATILNPGLQFLHIRAAFQGSMGNCHSTLQDYEAALCLDPSKVSGMNYPNKLNLNARLLSTKRPSGVNNKQMDRTCSTGNSRVPFSWEILPGKPKEVRKNDTRDEGDTVLSPKPPPGKWYLSKLNENIDDHGHECDGDLDDVNDDDVFSLSEKVNETGNCLSSYMVETLGDHSPDFMIQRFLPDANAVVASASLISASTLSIPIDHYPTHRHFPCSKKFPRDTLVKSQATVAGEPSYSSSTMRCGIDTLLFQWRSHMKPKPCTIKSPIVKCTSVPKSPLSRRRNSSRIAQSKQ